MPKGRVIDRKKVRELVEKGLIYIEIAKMLGFNLETVSQERRIRKEKERAIEVVGAGKNIQGNSKNSWCFIHLCLYDSQFK